MIRAKAPASEPARLFPSSLLWLGAAAGAACLSALAFGHSKSRLSLSGKVVLITGSSRGLGLALAEQYGRKGARLVLTARDRDALNRARQTVIARTCVRNLDNILCIPCDLTDYEQTRQLIEQATAHFGEIDVLVNNAGIITVGPVQDQPLSAFEDAIKSNYYTMVHATLAVLPQMLARHSGSIVNITSIGGKVSVPHLLPYSASKFAAVGFSQGLHAELRSQGIQVTTVCPGLMRTGSHTHALFTGDREREYRWFSLGASMPGVAASAVHAARKIVRATEDGRTEITITPQAFLAARLAQALPGCTAAAMHYVNSWLLPKPAAEPSKYPIEGELVRSQELTLLTQLGTRAAHRYNET